MNEVQPAYVELARALWGLVKNAGEMNVHGPGCEAIKREPPMPVPFYPGHTGGGWSWSADRCTCGAHETIQRARETLG